ncbi:hypothetical protein GIB67_038734 [Kingdonia uniflora]|uniref:Uncharacterized protein n=1 Tax=Kingdonia uniflora TaxID=39325 RepID=A0A7J7NSP1_9MAGN|nr:hypothetical protein GIB67_038734 [Kingdonia uniflora]
MDQTNATSKSILSRFISALLFTLLAFSFFYLSFISVIFITNFSIFNAVSIPVNCRIVSTSVDIRTAKVCESGFYNYIAENVFYTLKRRKFPCRSDYYWASVFKVEYRERSSGRTYIALAEVPKEALPIECRPNFLTAWLTKDKFKVNETYNCWYTPGISKVDIDSDSLMNCQANDPSVLEIIGRYFAIFKGITMSLFFIKTRSRAKYVNVDLVIGGLAGMFSAFILVGLVNLLTILKPRMTRNWEARKLYLAFYAAQLKRTCFLVVYFSVIGWLTIQYGKIFGLSKLFIRS